MDGHNLYKSFSSCFSFIEKTSSKYVGVCWDKKREKWKGSIWNNGKQHHIGHFEIEENAAKVVNSKCQEFNIPLKNSNVGVLDNEMLKKLKAKVIKFILNFRET